MKYMRYTAVAVLVLVILSSSTLYAADIDKLEKRINTCDEIIREVMQMPDKSIPVDLLSKCAAVAIFPYVIKGGFFVGARYGKGIVVAHDPKTNEWKPPAFFTLGGGSFGFQFGAQAMDLVLVIMNKRGLDGLLKDKFTLGADVAITAGPVGRVASADTDLLLKAGIYSYSRTKGIFAGVALKGAVIAPDKDANHTYYDGFVTTEEIMFENKVMTPASSKGLLETLTKASVKKK